MFGKIQRYMRRLKRVKLPGNKNWKRAYVRKKELNLETASIKALNLSVFLASSGIPRTS